MSRRTAVTLALFLSTILIGSGAGFASPADAARPSVKILKPKDGSRDPSRNLVALVRVNGADFQAFLNGRQVSGRFERVKGRPTLRRAVFRRGRDFKVGEADLFVTAGRGARPKADHVYFTAALRQNRLLRIKRIETPARMVPRFQIRSRGQVRISRVELNGRNMRRSFNLHPDLRGLSGMFDAGTSIRHGRNVARFRVVQKNGRVAERVFSFRIPRNAPIATAGADRRVGVSSIVGLDAGKSRKPASGDRRRQPLRFSWRLTVSPPGSSAKLASASTATPTLQPDVPGTYRAQVTVTSGNGTRSVDEVEIAAPQTVSPMGMPIQTITDQGSIQIGYPDQAGDATYPRLGNWVQMLVLDPDTATPMGGQWDAQAGVKGSQPGVLGFNAGQGSKLLAAVQKTKFQQMVILSGQGSAISMNGSDAGNLTKAINYLGGTVADNGPTPQGASNLAGGDWSVIGHQGLSTGQAYQNAFDLTGAIPGFLGGSAGQPGSLNGYLQSGINTIGYQFVSPEIVPIDTKWTPSLDQAPPDNVNTIRIGQASYQSQQIDNGSLPGCPCSVGVQLLVLDPSTLEPVEQGTYGILNSSGGTDFNGVYLLAQTLNQYVNQKGTSKLIVLQDFGRWSGANWPANSSDWVNDQIPNNNYTTNWKGNSYPTGADALLPMWFKGGPHGFGTVAANLGALAGLQVHDIVANYRRPVYDPNVGAVVPRTWGGLSVVASTNLYQWSSAYARGQGDRQPKNVNPLVNNGRLTGGLRRNEQSQWEITSPTDGAGYPGMVGSDTGNESSNAFNPTGLTELMNQPQTPWPCSAANIAPCSGTAEDVRQAMLYITSQLPDLGGPVDVRRLYLNDNIAWADQHTDIEDDSRIKCETQSNPGVCTTLRGLLAQEFEDLDQVKTGFGTMTNLLDSSSNRVSFDLGDNSDRVIAAVQKARKDLLKQEAEADAVGPITEALYAASEILELGLEAGQIPEELEMGPAAIGATASLIALGNELFPFFEQKTPSSESKVPDDTTLIKDRTSNLSKDLEFRLTAIAGTMKHFLDITRSDPVKLRTTAENFGQKWALDTNSELRMAQSISIGAGQSLYNSLMPIAMVQWVFSPRATQLNPIGTVDLPNTGYGCFHLNGDGRITGQYRPLQTTPPSLSAMTSVAFAANYGPNAQGYMVRALKMRQDNMKIEGAEFDTEDGDNYVKSNGGKIDPNLIDPLFEPPSYQSNVSFPPSFGMSKDEFFGQDGWTMQKLQCGL